MREELIEQARQKHRIANVGDEKFVQAQQARAGAQGAGDFHAALGAVGQGTRRCIGNGGEPQLGEPAPGEFERLAFGAPCDAPTRPIGVLLPGRSAP